MTNPESEQDRCTELIQRTQQPCGLRVTKLGKCKYHTDCPLCCSTGVLVDVPCCKSGICESCIKRLETSTCPFCRKDIRAITGKKTPKPPANTIIDDEAVARSLDRALNGPHPLRALHGHGLAYPRNSGNQNLSNIDSTDNMAMIISWVLSRSFNASVIPLDLDSDDDYY